MVADDLSGYAVSMTVGDIVDLQRIAVRPVRPPQRPRHPAARRLLEGTGDAVRMLLEVSDANATALAFYVARRSA